MRTTFVNHFLLLAAMFLAGVKTFAELVIYPNSNAIEINGIYYYLRDDNTACVTYQNKKWDQSGNVGQFVGGLSDYSGYVVIPESVTYNDRTYNVTSIGHNAFDGCTGITSITIPSSVTSIGSNAFSGCTGITSITIPSSVTSIGSWAFNSCPDLTDVYCYAKNVPETGNRYVFNSYWSATLHVPAGSLEAYRTTAPWSDFGTIVAIEDDEVTATDVSAMSYAVYAQPAIARKGSQATLSVCMKNTQPITLWQADLMLPAGFTIATDSYGDPMVSISGGRTSTSRHSISTSTLSDGSIRILCS